MVEIFTKGQIERQAVIVLILWLIPLLAYFVDFWTGVEGANASGEKLHSKGFRKTVVKIGEYWRFQLMALLIDVVGLFVPGYTLPYVSMIATISIILIEFASVRENFKKKRSSRTLEAIGASETLLTEIIGASTKYDAAKILEKLKNNDKGIQK